MLTGGDGGTILATPTHISQVDKRPVALSFVSEIYRVSFHFNMEWKDESVD